MSLRTTLLRAFLLATTTLGAGCAANAGPAEEATTDGPGTPMDTKTIGAPLTLTAVGSNGSVRLTGHNFSPGGNVGLYQWDPSKASFTQLNPTVATSPSSPSHCTFGCFAYPGGDFDTTRFDNDPNDVSYTFYAYDVVTARWSPGAVADPGKYPF
jgi:hypothetical protein